MLEANPHAWGWAGDQATKQTTNGLVSWNCSAIPRWDPEAVTNLTKFGLGAPVPVVVLCRTAPFEDGKTACSQLLHRHL